MKMSILCKKTSLTPFTLNSPFLVGQSQTESTSVTRVGWTNSKVLGATSLADVKITLSPWLDGPAKLENKGIYLQPGFSLQRTIKEQRSLSDTDCEYRLTINCPNAEN